MGNDEKRARFERLRQQIRDTALRAGQATLATGVLVLCAPSGGINTATAEDEIGVVDYHQADAAARVSEVGRVMAGPGMPIADFGDAFTDWSDTTPA